MLDPLDLIWAVEVLSGKKLCEGLYRRITGLLEIDASDQEILEALETSFGGLYKPHPDQLLVFLTMFDRFGDPYYKALLIRRASPELWEVADMCNGDPETLISCLTPTLSELAISQLAVAYAIVREMQHSGPIYA